MTWFIIGETRIWSPQLDRGSFVIKIPRANDAGSAQTGHFPQCRRLRDLMSRNLLKVKRLKMLNWPTLYRAPA